MGEDLDLERVVNDPDYRRKAIEDLNHGVERPHGADSQSRGDKPYSPADSETNAAKAVPTSLP